MDEGRKITDLTEITSVADNDILLGVDVSDTSEDPTGSSKKFTKLGLFSGSLKPPDGFLINGKIAVTVASNNLTLALKTLAGTDPSATDPAYIYIGGTMRSITSALSVTKNAGTNRFNAGSSELATKEIDYFVYLGYNATDGVVIGFARMPYAREYDDFSTTSTDEKYCAISTITTAASGDDYVVIGRFAATLSAGAGYTWTVPTFTNKNLIQRPIYESRWLSWQPVYSASGSMTWTSVTTNGAVYKIIGDMITLSYDATGTTGGSASNTLVLTTPFDSRSTGVIGGGGILVVDGSNLGGFIIMNPAVASISHRKYDGSNFALASGKRITNLGLSYPMRTT